MMCDEAQLSWRWLKPLCRWEVVNEFPVLLRLHKQLLLSFLNCLYLNPQVFSLLPFRFSPP